MALFGSLSTLRAQCAGLDYFAPAFAYLDDLATGGPAAQRLQGLGEGESHRVELADGVFAIEQVYRTKSRTEGRFESHRRYIDVQVVVSGAEVMEVADISRLPADMAYDGERDLIFYRDPAVAAVLPFQAGEGAVFFPVDGHKPSLSPEAGSQLVRKTVVKIPVPS